MRRNNMDKKTKQGLLELQDKINLMADMLLVVTDYLGTRDDEFRREFMVATLANDKIRNEFTDYLMSSDAPDGVKLSMTEINEEILSIMEEE